MNGSMQGYFLRELLVSAVYRAGQAGKGGTPEMKTPYDDIIHLPHHVSRNHPQMPMLDRAAQFAPFAALTGYEATVGETARLTAERRELDAQEAEELNPPSCRAHRQSAGSPGGDHRIFRSR